MLVAVGAQETLVAMKLDWSTRFAPDVRGIADELIREGAAFATTKLS